jgi:hypothetical protein
MTDAPAGGTKTHGARVPAALIDAARTGLGLPADARPSDVLRAALAHAGRVELSDYPLAKPGPKPRPRPDSAAA